VRGKAILAGAAAAAVLGAGAAQAGGDADTKVTIKAPGSEVYGYVKSSKENKCANDRLVKVFRQKGGSQGGGDDVKIGSDRAQPNGDRYMWSIGNPGVQGKKIFAKAGRIPGCLPDASPTIVAGT
jgi:hypothetical protein